MTIKELKEILAEIPEEMLVVVARDSEGNGFSPCLGVSKGIYMSYSSWSGQALPENDKRALKNGAVRACFFWPTE